MAKRTRKGPLITKYQPESKISESFRSIRTSIKYAITHKQHKVILLTSAIPGEGKSTITANLALMTAQDNMKVLIIDGDIRRPNLHHMFNVPNRSGLSSILSGYSNLEQSIIETETTNLWILPAGPIQPNPSELLGSSRMEELILRCREQFDIIFFDTPPILIVADANILARVTDSILLVHRILFTKKDQVIKAQQKLETFRDKILGIIINDKKDNSF